MNRLYKFFIPGWTAARAENPLLTSLGRRRHAREQRTDWLLALGLVVWVGVCMAGQMLPMRYLQSATLGNSGLLMFLIRYPLEFVVDMVELLGLFVALLIMMRGALEQAQTEDWATAPISSRDVTHYVLGRAVGLLLKASLIGIAPLALFWISVGQIFRGIGDWEWVLYWCIMLPVSLFIRVARIYFMSIVMVAILTRRRLATDAVAECAFTAAGILFLFVVCDASFSALLSWIWLIPSLRELMGSIVLSYVLYNVSAPLIFAVVMVLWGRRIARASAGRFWEWWLDGPRAWRWSWTKGLLFSK